MNVGVVTGGIRPQNFDAAYRPDGPRVVFDSRTLNDFESVGKNWQNMVNDLATEAATVHRRFPYAIVAFIIIIPKPALGEKQKADIVRTLERLGTRKCSASPRMRKNWGQKCQSSLLAARPSGDRSPMA